MYLIVVYNIKFLVLGGPDRFCRVIQLHFCRILLIEGLYTFGLLCRVGFLNERNNRSLFANGENDERKLSKDSRAND